MARKAFYSFHYDNDSWRAAQVRNMGVIEGETPVSDNDWESITGGGDAAIKRWIDGQLYGKSCVIVLIGQHTAGRKWIDYEIERAWELKKGLVGVYVHGLKDRHQATSMRGNNPFEGFNVGGVGLTTYAKAHDPIGYDSTAVYRYIKENLLGWVEAAVSMRLAVG